VICFFGDSTETKSHHLGLLCQGDLASQMRVAVSIFQHGLSTPESKKHGAELWKMFEDGLFIVQFWPVESYLRRMRRLYNSTNRLAFG
jgi:hypothetical protein